MHVYPYYADDNVYIAEATLDLRSLLTEEMALMQCWGAIFCWNMGQPTKQAVRLSSKV